MEIRGKEILIIGLGKSGVAATYESVRLGGLVSVYDDKDRDKIEKDFLSFLDKNNLGTYFNQEPENLSRFYIAIVSPGVPLDVPLLLKLKEVNVKIIGELEFAYLLSKGKYIAITGTNGKTTTTTLVGEIFKADGRETFVVGNIGTPVVSKAAISTEDTWLVTETSSFQLETTENFKPKISALLNLTPDHLNRHKTMEIYRDTKANIFKNQNNEDFFIVNYDDEPSFEIAKKCKGKVIYFSRKEKLKLGAFVSDNQVTILDENNMLHSICGVNEIKILGTHNLENVLAAAAICFFAGINEKIIGDTIRNFGGVEHRLEVVDVINGVRFINDSKGTNPDASIKAIEAMEGNVILIAGGYDKDSDFTKFVQAFDGKVEYLILLGVTAPKIKETATRLGFTNSIIASNMEECVDLAFKKARVNSTVLLSPASASWDMYTCFEERGEDFKNCVKKLK